MACTRRSSFGCAASNYYCLLSATVDLASFFVPQGYRKAVQLAVDRLNVISVKFDEDPAARRALLEKCAKTSLNSKLIARYQVRWQPPLLLHADSGSNLLAPTAL